jgi:hypothetical protein
MIQDRDEHTRIIEAGGETLDVGEPHILSDWVKSMMARRQ